MKIRLLSDLHLEMPYNKAPVSTRPFIYEHLGEDVVVLAGDIHNHGRHREIIDLIIPHCKVLLIAGNHEAYGASFEGVHDHLYNLQADCPNFYYLNNDSMIIDDVDFFGGVMYTSLEGENIDALCRRFIPDFSVIHKEANIEELSKDTEGFINFNPKWTPQDHRDAHQKFCKELGYWKLSSKAEKKVVISHFVPTYKALAPQFEKSALNPYFIEDMEKYMNGIDVWLFGHTHTSFDFMIEETRLVSNPYGYGDENKSGFIFDKIVEI
jgi:predicted phosphodiesterase